MGDVVTLFARHDRASSVVRAASSASLSSVTPERHRSDAAEITRGQRAAGIESRVFIARAWLAGIPIASPNLAGPPKASMIEMNESMAESLHQVAIHVNTACSASPATLCGMKPRETLEKQQGRRLRQARKEAGYKSAREAALDNGWTYVTYGAHERGTRTIGRDDADKYIRVFKLRGTKITSRDVLFPDYVDGAALASTETASEAYMRGWHDATQAIAQSALDQRPPAAVPKKSRLRSR